MDQEKEGVVISSHLYVRHALHNSLAKVGNGSEKRKRGLVVIPSHLYIRHAHLHNSPAIVRNASEKRKREWLLLVNLTLTSHN